MSGGKISGEETWFWMISFLAIVNTLVMIMVVAGHHHIVPILWFAFGTIFLWIFVGWLFREITILEKG